MVENNPKTSLELLYSISRELANEIELHPLLKKILTLSIRNVGAERGSIVILNESGRPVDAAIIYGEKIYTHTVQQLRETVEKGMAGWVVRHHKAVLVNDTRQDTRWLRRPDDETNRSGSKSALCVPLLAHQKLVGVLTVVHPQIGFFNPDHMSLLQSIGDIAGIASLNARLYAESDKRARVMTALIDNAIAINSSLHLNEVLQRLLEHTKEALQVEVVALGLVDPAIKELEIRAATGENAVKLVGTRIPLGKGIAGRVAIDGKAIIANEAFLEDADRIPGFSIESFACAPLRAESKIIGVLEAINPKSEGFEQESLILLNAFGSLAGTAVRNAQLFEQIQATNLRYMELFEDNIDPILITNLDGKIIEANRQSSRVTKYNSAQLQDKNIQEVHTLNSEKLGENYNNLPSTGAITYESDIRTQDGREIPVQVYARRIEYYGANSIQWILRDISERVDLDSLRNDLIAMIYHDLRSPLANVTASLDILSSLENGENDETTASLLNIAMRSSDRIQRLLNSLLDTYRLEAGQSIVNLKDVNPSTLIKEVVDIIQPTLESKSQQLALKIQENLDTIRVDPDMIRRVFVNLAENASKFSSISANIEIGAKTNDGSIQFWVMDDGPGIPKEDQERVFDKFSRLKMNGSAKGMGLGLAFCRLAVAGHGGNIWVESTQGKGSCFFFSLPIKSTMNKSKDLDN